MIAFTTGLLGLVAFTSPMIDAVRPDLRDPEYGKRLVRLRARIAESPERPIAVVLGSSRTAMGVRPQASESESLLFNMGRVGGGPMFELLTLRRLLADGIRPDVVILEYWPPMMYESGAFDERDRLDAARLSLDDMPFVHEYHPDPRFIEREILAMRLNPIFTYRQRWLAELAPSWVPSSKRVEPGCRGMDDWGWVPGLDHDPELRPARLTHFEPIYREHFAGFQISPDADCAIRDCIALARNHGARVAFAYMPESSEFRQWYTPSAERLAREHLNGLCRELDVPLIDARCWMADDCLVDGFHLSPSGAASFIRRFITAIGELDWHAPRNLR